MISDPIAQFRSLTPEQQVREGEDSLMAHVFDKAMQARLKHPNLGIARIEAFLADRECCRYPVRVVYEYGSDMAPHQVAQPEPDYRTDDTNAVALYVRPQLRNRPDLALTAIAYMLPTINYGDVIGDEHCLVYAAALLGFTEDECYERLCEAADFCGSEVKLAEPKESRPPEQDHDHGGCSCGSGGCGR